MSNSPWGQIQHSTDIAEGIRSVQTASHGGILLSPPRLAEFRAKFPNFEPWAGVAGAFEEDCDWAAVALAFPQYFDDQTLYNAVRTQETAQLKGCIPAECRARADAYAATIAGKWEIGSYGSSPDGYPRGAWGVGLRRGAEHKRVVFANYPDKQFYTDAEIIERLAEPVPA